MIWRRGLLVPILLLVGCLLVLWGIIQVWTENGPGPDPGRGRKSPEVPKAAPLRDQRPLNAFAVVASKNLFTQSRSGPGLGAGAPKAKATLEGRRLLGVIIIGEERAAMISSAPTPGPRRLLPPGQTQIEVVRLGEEWEGFTVVEISSEAVVFLGKEGKKTLNFPE